VGIAIGPNGKAVRVQSTTYASLNESITDVARQIEDLNWNNLSTDRPSYDLVYDDRKRLLQRIRLYRRRSPLAKQGAMLLQHYVLGKGVSLKANNKAKVARIVDEFWEDPVNLASFTSHQAQKERIDGLWTDGDMFLILFPDKTNGALHMGYLDSLFVEDIVTDPENSAVPKWYKARAPQDDYDFTNGTYTPGLSTDFYYLRDWRNADNTTESGKAMKAPPADKVHDGLVYHVRINKRGKFGESEMAAAVDWLKAHKDFMEDRASLNRAAAQIAWKKKRKGPASDIAAEVAKMQSSLINNMQRYESNPPAASASTIVENEGTEMSWVKTDTGGQGALSDERILRMMSGAGMGGIPNHYFGDEANANLATATAMELPLLKNYQDWQKLWGDIITDVIQFLLATAHEAGRIGDRDDSRRYAERVTTPQQVLNTPSADGTDAPKLPSVKGLTSGPKIPGIPAVADTNPDSKLNEAEMGGATVWPRDPDFAITLIPKHEPSDVLFGANDTSGAIDWFVDVDFSPIIERDQQMIMNSLKTLYEFLPTGNIESQKFIVETALMAMGQNNIDEMMERLFPLDMSPTDLNTPIAPANQGALQAALAQGLAAGVKPQALLGAGAAVTAATPPIPPGQEQKDVMTEAASLQEYRIRRVLRAARQATDALDAIGG
jgi:hypothetical protein